MSTESSDTSEDDVEQLASDGEFPQPKGEHRETTSEEDAGSIPAILGYRTSGTFGGDANVPSEKSSPPEKIRKFWRKYYKEFALTRAPLQDFDLAVMEPGYRIRVEDPDGERDEEMEEALQLWASNCVIHAGEIGHDLTKLLGSLPSKRRGKGTALIEKVGTEEDPDAMAALMSLDPSTFKIYTRKDQTILIQPDDDVDDDHPRTEDGEAAAYNQYDEDLPRYDEKDPIPFGVDDIIKLTYDADDGEVWGTSVFEACSGRIDSLRQKLEDRDYSIRQTGYAHRIYSSKNWSQKQAEDYADAHKEGDVSSEYGPGDDDDSGGEKDSFAGRVDFVPDEVNVQVEEGTVPDISDAVRDDIEQIFSVMPVGKYQIAYADDLNQFVVDPQMEKDNEKVDKERQYLERKFKPVLEEKADELASGDRYEGDVHFSIEPEQDENPLRRDNFPAENLKALIEALGEFADAGVDRYMPPAAFAELAGFDLEELRERHDWDADPLELDDEDDTPDDLLDDDEEEDDGAVDGEEDGDEE